MAPFHRLLTLAFFSLSAHALSIRAPVTPAGQGVPSVQGQTLDPQASVTDSNTIQTTVNQVEQGSGPSDDAPPNALPPPTTVTADNGVIQNASIPNPDPENAARSLTLTLIERGKQDYRRVFAGTGEPGGLQRDAAIEGTAYLTYTLVQNDTYNVDACLDFCSNTDGCVFVNLYYEFNNYLLDKVFSEHSNLKCVAFGDIHTAQEKTNEGGQQSYPIIDGQPLPPLTYIQDSSGWALKEFLKPLDPPGYELVFGPTNGANNAPGYMGFSLLTRYDVRACALLCNARNPDANGGACQYFNIWRAVIKDKPKTYTCAMYYLPTDESTAVNYGQGDLQVTLSRGYRRIDYVVDGGFEGYNACAGFCFATSYANWIGSSPTGGTLDATVFHYQPYAHFGSGVGLLGSATGADTLAGTLAPVQPLQTKKGKKYIVTFFQSSSFSGRTLEADAFVDVMWNGNIVATITPGYTNWKYFSVKVTASGNDMLAFRGGKAPAWSFIDDVHAFLA